MFCLKLTKDTCPPSRCLSYQSTALLTTCGILPFSSETPRTTSIAGSNLQYAAPELWALAAPSPPRTATCLDSPTAPISSTANVVATADTRCLQQSLPTGTVRPPRAAGAARSQHVWSIRQLYERSYNTTGRFGRTERIKAWSGIFRTKCKLVIS